MRHTNLVVANAAYWAQSQRNFSERYAELRSWGMTHERIAQQFGVKRESLIRRCTRLGIYMPERTEAELLARLDHLIESGEPFDATELSVYGRGLLGGVMRRAASQGRIRSIGSRANPNGGRRTQIWCGVETGQAVAS